MSEEDDMQEISPEEIKRIRKSLGLSQAEAGKLLGGGPSAFAKYEKGSVRPSASLAKILRFLHFRPEELEALTTGRENTTNKAGTTPFEVTSEHVSALGAREFSVLVGKLLSAEAQESDIPLDGIHVSYETSAPDGGEDARIEWRDGPSRTGFLPSKLCQFQLKTGGIFPADAGKEVLDSGELLKPMIREVLEKGGFYIMLCSRDYSKKAIQARESSILENIRKHLPKTEEIRVQFRDSGQIAAWVAGRPPAALWLLKKTRPTLANPSFGNWDHWSGREEHFDAQWVEDPRLPDFREKLLSTVRTPKEVARVAGPSGAGKSRLALEAFRPTQKEETSGVRLSDLVLYAVESESGSSEINKLAWDLVNSKRRSVLVVDRCSEETRADLAGIVRHSDSKVSLVTINDEVPSDAGESNNVLLRVNRADYYLIEKIVKSIDSNISEQDRRRIVLFSDGIVECARIISKSWSKYGLAASDDDDALIKKFIGHGDDGSSHVYKAAKLMGALGTIQTDNMLAAKDPERDEALEQAVSISGVSPQDILDALEILEKRGVVQLRMVTEHCGTGQRHKCFATLRPEHIALKLAERQWKQWNKVFNSLPEKLIGKTVSRLSLLNTRPVAVEVARKICGKAELWFPKEKLEENCQLLVPLAEIDPDGVLTLLENHYFAEIKELSETARREIGSVLSKIAFLGNDRFEDAALLLFKLAVKDSSAEDRFTRLFPARLAYTNAGPEKRLRVMNEIVENDNCPPVAVDALLEGAKTAFFHRTTDGSETHGSRPAFESWRAETVQELSYVKECVERLVKLARREDDAGEHARCGLGGHLGRYVLDISIDDVEKWTQEVGNIHPYWPEAIGSLDNLLMNHSADLSVSVRQRVEALISKLDPDNLKDRVRFLVTEMPYGYLGRRDDNIRVDHDEMLKSQKSELERLADDLLARESELKKFVPQLSTGEHRTAREFGTCLAEKAPEPLSLKTLITDAVEKAPDKERDFELLIGYMQGLARRHPEELEKFKNKAAKSRVFAPVLPTLTLCTGIGSEDVTMVIDALESNLIPPHMMRNWGYGGQLSRLRPDEVAPLFSFMLEKKDPLLFSEAVFLMGTYTYKQRKYLENLRPQLLRAAEYPSVAEKPYGGPATLHETERNAAPDNFDVASGFPEPGDESSDLLEGWDEAVNLFHDMSSKGPDNESASHYETLMNWLLSKGIEDFDAGEAAMIIAGQIVKEDFSYSTIDMIREIMPCLLSNFADLVWPTLGRAVAENESKTRRFLEMLGHKAPRAKGAPILNLPENMLFGWCRANPEIGPAFAAKALPIAEKLYETESYRVMHVVIEAVDRLRAGEEKITDDEVHPTARRLLDEFGERGDVLEMLELNIRYFCGGYKDYIILFREPLRSIADHEKGPVRRWIGKMLRKVDERIEEIRMQDKDRGIDWRGSDD